MNQPLSILFYAANITLKPLLKQKKGQDLTQMNLKLLIFFVILIICLLAILYSKAQKLLGG